MSWARTVRFKASDEATDRRIATLASFEGVRAAVSAPAFGRAYALVQGPDSVDPAEVAAAIDAQWYDEAITVLAIEPRPADALPHLHAMLCGPGGPSGILAAEIDGKTLIVESSPRTLPQLILAAVNAELHRWHGTFITTVLAPMPEETLAAIAAAGLQTPEIVTDRILESLLDRARVE
ncbi:MAG TPA: hypothetical protein VFL13_16325 [Candidatus Baltobacteraceae bacterium]|nr:hypothetical protein [Candidatus Baltobacteraceae bacterium]